MKRRKGTTETFVPCWKSPLVQNFADVVQSQRSNFITYQNCRIATQTTSRPFPKVQKTIMAGGNAPHRCSFEEIVRGRNLNVQKIQKFILQSNSGVGTQGRPVCCFFVFLGNLSRSSEEMGKRCTRVKLVLRYFSLYTALLMSISRCTRTENLQNSSNLVLEI